MKKQPTFSLFNKILHTILIVFVGGVSSLTYFDAFMPGHEHANHAFHLSIFEAPHSHNPLPPPEGHIIYPVHDWATTIFNSNTSFIDTPIQSFFRSSTFFTSGFNLGYLLVVAVSLLFIQRLWGRVFSLETNDTSVILPPIEKPPSFSTVFS